MADDSENAKQVKNLYRLPVTNCGDIPRHCLTCQEPPTEFAVVKSEGLAVCYFFCDACLVKYLNEPLFERIDHAF
jgi:hypothetical protein